MLCYVINEINKLYTVDDMGDFVLSAGHPIFVNGMDVIVIIIIVVIIIRNVIFIIIMISIVIFIR